MKLFIPLLSVLLLITACQHDDDLDSSCYQLMDIYKPVQLSLNELRTIAFENSREMENTGKIYVYKQYLFVNEIQKGIHIIDNSNQANPENIGFISIQGNRDIAVKNDVLYADNFVELLAIDITTITQPKIIDIQDNLYAGWYNSDTDLDLKLYVGSESVGKKIINTCDFSRCTNCDYSGGMQTLTNGTQAYPSGGGNTQTTGQGGSLTRFALSNDRLYAVDESSLYTININGAGEIDLSAATNVGWGIETIFSTGNQLYLGSSGGMFIYLLDNPNNPEFASELRHVEACDPVIVDQQKAYITLSSSNTCVGDVNELIVADVSDSFNPSTILEMDMSNPKGLGIYDDYLFICDGESGIRVYDKNRLGDYITDQITHIPNVDAKDIILLANKTAIVLTPNSYVQYDFSDIQNIRFISDFIYR